VEEISLRVHIACLRKALDRGQSGEHYIINVTGRGCFWAPVSYERFTLDLKPPALDSKNQRNAALQPSDVALLNRSRKVLREALKSFCSQRRFCAHRIEKRIQTNRENVQIARPKDKSILACVERLLKRAPIILNRAVTTCAVRYELVSSTVLARLAPIEQRRSIADEGEDA
jgi:hypothetical protein